MTSPTPPSLQASIHIGACSISLLIVEKHTNTEDEPGDFLEQSIPLGHDIFRGGNIRRSTIERCVKILNGYLETLRELGATEDTEIRAVATNIVSEAKNRDTFLNRIQIGCGLHIETIDEGEMTRLIYLKTRRRLRDTPSMKKRTTLVVHVGPGNTRALLFKNGRISDYSNYRLGVYRTGEPLAENQDAGVSTAKMIREHTHSQISQIHHDYIDAGIEELVVIGYEIQHLAHELAKPGKTKSSYLALADLSLEISTMSEEKRVKKYQLDYNTAQSIVTALEINLAIAETLQVETLRLPGSDYERGLLLDIPTSFPSRLDSKKKCFAQQKASLVNTGFIVRTPPKLPASVRRSMRQPPLCTSSMIMTPCYSNALRSSTNVATSSAPEPTKNTLNTSFSTAKSSDLPRKTSRSLLSSPAITEKQAPSQTTLNTVTFAPRTACVSLN